MDVNLRPGTPADIEPCGRIVYQAFKTIAERHGFPPDLPDVEVATGLAAMCLTTPHVYSVVAEQSDRVVGSNFLWEGDPIAGVGPITVDPTVQNSAVGRRLMDDVVARAYSRPRPGVRLVQAAYHSRSLALYTKLGFDPCEPLSVIQGEPPGVTLPGRTVRPARPDDVSACAAVCTRVHGYDRSTELGDAVERATATVVEHGGRISGYATSIGFFGHAVGETNEDVAALITAAPAYLGLGFLLPTRNAELLRWCLVNGLRIVQPMTLMAMGEYRDPEGACLPSIMY